MYIVTGDSKGSLRLWDWELGDSGEQTLEGHEYRVRAVTFSSDGCLVASGAQDHSTNPEPMGSVRFWDANTGCPTGLVLTGNVRPSVSLAFSPSKRHLVSVDWSGNITRWDLQSGKSITYMIRQYSWQRSVSGDKAQHAAIAFSQDESIIAFAFDCSLAVFDAHTYRPTTEPWNRAVTNPIHALTFSPSGNSIAVACEREIVIWHCSVDVWTTSPTALTSYDCDGQLVRTLSRGLSMESETGALTHLQWVSLPGGREGLIKGAVRNENNFYMREGWVLDGDGRKHCWVPEIYRGQDVQASWGNKVALGGGNGQVMLLQVLPGLL